MTEPTCTCAGVADALRYALHDQTPPACAVHTPTESTDLSGAMALNDNQALAAAIGAQLTKEI